MKAITVRNIDDELAVLLRKESKRQGRSINSLILESIRSSLQPDAAGASPFDTERRTPRRDHDLDHLAGTWTSDEERSFSAAIAPLDEIDEELWNEPHHTS